MTPKNSFSSVLTWLAICMLIVMLVATTIIMVTMVEKNLATDFSMFYSAAKDFLKHHLMYMKIDWAHYNVRKIATVYKHIPPVIPFLGVKHSTELNSPFFILLITPLALLTYQQALACWLLISFIAGVGAFLYLLKKIFPQRYNLLFMVAGLAAFLGSITVYSNFGYAELGLFIFAGLVFSWTWSRSGRDKAAGVLLGLLLTLKLFIGMFLIYFLFLKRWRLLAYMVTTFIILNLITLCIVGSKNYIDYIAILHVADWFAASWNASLYGFLSRIFGGSFNQPILNIPIIAHSLYIISAIFVVSVLFFNTRQQKDDKQRFDLNFSYVLCAMILLSPLGWVYYFPVLLIALLLSIKFIEKYYYNLPIIFTLLISLFLMNVPYMLVPAQSANNPAYMFTRYAYQFYGLLILFVVLVILLYKQAHMKLIGERTGVRQHFPFAAIWLALLPSLNLLLVSAFK